MTCDLCSHPYPYMCKECNMEIVNDVIQTSAQDLGLLPTPQAKVYQPTEPKPAKIFIGAGEIIPMWTEAEHCDCGC